MGQRAHRIKKITYAKGVLFTLGDNLADAIIEHADTNDFRNQDGGGVVEIPLRSLVEILDNAKGHKLDAQQIKELKVEIKTLKKEGKDEDDYIIYDIY